MLELVIIYYDKGKKEKAKEWYERSAIKGNTRAMNKLGEFYYKEGEKEKAKELYEKAVILKKLSE